VDTNDKIKKMNRKIYTIGETFVGAGGSHLGFKEIGFEAVFINDCEKEYLETIVFNNPELKENCFIINDYIQNINTKEILKKANIKKGDLDVLFGGVVCKGFSLAGVRDPNDIRNTLYKEQLRLVKDLRPKFSVIENVPGMQNLKITSSKTPQKIKDKITETWKMIDKFKGIKSDLTKKNLDLSKKELQKLEEIKERKKELEQLLLKTSISVVEDIENIYTDLGYTLYKSKLKSHWYGAATNRERLILIAVRNDLKIKNFEFPKKEFDYDLDKKPKTINQALKEIDYKGKNNPLKDNDNQPMNHSPKSIARFKLIPEGKNIVEVLDKVPDELKISGYYSRGCTMRLDRNKCAPTLVPGHSNFPVHPTEHRSITVREAAVISGFPLNYKFFGSHTLRCEQVGQAVPPPMAKAIAKQIKKYLDNL